MVSILFCDCQRILAFRSLGRCAVSCQAQLGTYFLLSQLPLRSSPMSEGKQPTENEAKDKEGHDNRMSNLNAIFQWSMKQQSDGTRPSELKEMDEEVR